MPTSVLERQTAEAIEHKKRMHENMEKICAAGMPQETPTHAAASSAPARSEAVRTAPARTAEPARTSAPARTVPVRTEAPTAPSAPSAPAVQDEVYTRPITTAAPAPAPAQTEAASAWEESADAMPTTRTMARQALRETERAARTVQVQAHTEERAHFWQSLSFNMRLTLSLVAVALVVIVAVIFINTGVINSMQHNIAERQDALASLSARAEEVLGEIDRVTDPAYVDDYAEHVLGMVHP